MQKAIKQVQRNKTITFAITDGKPIFAAPKSRLS